MRRDSGRGTKPEKAMRQMNDEGKIETREGPRAKPEKNKTTRWWKTMRGNDRASRGINCYYRMSCYKAAARHGYITFASTSSRFVSSRVGLKR